MEAARASESAQQIAQGAEARVFAARLNGRAAVVKERFAKAYRHPDIDLRLRSTRMAQEARMLLRARQAGVCTPVLHYADMTACALYLERIDGPTVKRFIQEHHLDDMDALASAIGAAIALLHDAHITHGDLTTSNMLLRGGSTAALVLIDFGLSQTTTLAKDKAVDMYVCEKAFLSTHPDSEGLFARVLGAYRATSKHGAEVVSHLDKVRARGRKKVCLG